MHHQAFRSPSCSPDMLLNVARRWRREWLRHRDWQFLRFRREPDVHTLHATSPAPEVRSNQLPCHVPAAAVKVGDDARRVEDRDMPATQARHLQVGVVTVQIMKASDAWQTHAMEHGRNIDRFVVWRYWRKCA